MSFRIIGICGHARHGKDTAAEAFLQRGGVYRIALADKLKEDVAELYPDFPEFAVAYDELGRISYPNMRPDTDPWRKAVVRRTWQVWGTQGRRYIFADYWLWQFADRAMQKATEGFGAIVIPDVRFKNEAEHIRNTWGGIIVGVDRGDYREPGVDYTHDSEREVPEILADMANYRVFNDETEEQFKARINLLALEIMGG